MGWTSSVVVVEEDTIGGGVEVVVCSVVAVRVIGVGPQLASTAVPARSAAPIARPKRDFVSIIVLFLSVRAVAGSGPIRRYSSNRELIAVSRGSRGDPEITGQRTVVVSVDFFVDVVSPIGDTVVPLEVDPVVVVETPLELVVFWLLVSTATDGITAVGVVVDVVVELEDELCAKAAPVIKVTAIVATSMDLIMSVSPVSG